ncbi:hypothetical protein QFZ66_002288 [Streptomyces sp. B4I13]|uniref:hypothetical protein n=1 Tax=Streptomyces sp. B4I13 TaxID=3042271 RepID=UPI0027889BFA|nr:hypothetical protein [Streptomyces sp. B4I13]MDQ0958410.1 hypothetical protein [Streptomyces sp. B4I13]
MNETNAGGVRQRSVETVTPVHDEEQVPAARMTAPAPALPAGATTHLEYAT